MNRATRCEATVDSLIIRRSNPHSTTRVDRAASRFARTHHARIAAARFRMSRIDAALGALPKKRVADAHHGARDALTPLGLAKFRAYFRAQPALAAGIDIDSEITGISTGYALRVGRQMELEPMLRAALPIEKPSIAAPDRETLKRAFGGLRGAPYVMADEDKGPIAPAIAAVIAAKTGTGSAAEEKPTEKKRKRDKSEKKEKKSEKKRRRDSMGATMSEGGTISQGQGTTSGGGAPTYSQASGETKSTGGEAKNSGE
jgi:hypothetical protein